MAVSKPLLEEEVSENYRSRVHFDSQFQESYRYSNRTKMRTMVWIDCDVCMEPNKVTVNDVRRFNQGSRAQFPGTHRKCKYPGRSVRPDGYVLIWKPDHPNAYQGKYVMEHILVMEQALGRHLDTSVESVHHIDGNRSNNSIDNLQLRFAYHGKGQAWKCNSCGSTDVRPTELS